MIFTWAQFWAWAVPIIVSCILTTCIAFLLKRWMTKYFDKADKERKQKEDAEKELADYKKQEADEKLTETLNNTIQEAIKPLTEKIDGLDKKLAATAEGTLATLRNDILTCYYRCREKGYRNDYDYQNIHDLYEAYVALDGNSFVEDIMNRFDNLPVKEEIKEIDVHLVSKKSAKNKSKGEN